MTARDFARPEGVKRAERIRLARLVTDVDFPAADSDAYLVSFYRHRHLEQMRKWVAAELKPFWFDGMSQNDAEILCESRASHVVGRALYHAETRVLREAVRDISLFFERGAQ